MKNKWKWILVCSVMCLLVGCGSKETDQKTDIAASMLIDDVFTISGRGTVATGMVESGKICVGDEAVLIKEDGTEVETVILSLEAYRELIEEAEEGDSVGAQLEGLEYKDVSRGDRLVIYAK